jgi:hypothetical protein
MHDAVPRVQEQCMKFLLWQILQPRAHATKDIGRASNPVRVALRLRRRTSPQLQRRDDA